MNAALDSHFDLGSMTTGSGEAAGEIVAKRQPEGRDERERASQTTAVVAIHHLPCLHQDSRCLATNQYEISGLV
ncbi:MAG: hypothetical protein QE493_06180 [Verrucomicrobiae bacterium]|nr:hypothetical protein [Verrucomicrobiae bacterium]